MPTIRSRSQLVFFAPISHTLLTQYLETEYQVSSQQAEEITQLAHGLPEDAIALLDSDKLELRKNLQRDTQIFISGTITQRFAVAKTVHEQKTASQFVSELSYAIWQQSSILMHGESDSQNSISNLEKVLQAQAQLLANVSSRTTLENLALQLEHN